MEIFCKILLTMSLALISGIVVRGFILETFPWNSNIREFFEDSKISEVTLTILSLTTIFGWLLFGLIKIWWCSDLT